MSLTLLAFEICFLSDGGIAAIMSRTVQRIAFRRCKSCVLQNHDGLEGRCPSAAGATLATAATRAPRRIGGGRRARLAAALALATRGGGRLTLFTFACAVLGHG